MPDGRLAASASPPRGSERESSLSLHEESFPKPGSACRLPHVAVLVFLAAAARARFVATDPLTPVADRLDHFRFASRIGAELVGLGPGRRLVNGRADGPKRFLKGLR